MKVKSRALAYIITQKIGPELRRVPQVFITHTPWKEVR